MKPALNANQIKVIAILAMTIDHIAWMLFPGYPHDILPLILHTVGRVTCPVMCYFIAEGYRYSRDVRKYRNRLFVFAVVSHFAYIYASGNYVDWRSFIPFYYGDVLNQTSVMWPLAWGLVMLQVADSPRIREKAKPILVILICLITFPSDWSCIASLCILAFGTNRGCFKKQMLWIGFYVALYSIVYMFAIDPVYGLMQMGVVLAIPILGLYNGQRSTGQRMNRIMKWVFYLYYPLHLGIIGWLQSVF